MISQKTSGINAPSKIAKPGSLLTRSVMATGPTTAPSNNSQPYITITSELKIDATDALAQSSENYKVGDKVWVNGTKHGCIQFLGGTQFAPGQWAGVVLDEPLGKNDGSVGGVRYFQCESNKGVFARPHKLSRVPISSTNTPTNGTLQTNSDKTLEGKMMGSTTRLLSSLTPGSAKEGMTPCGVTNNAASDEGLVKVGDRVLVNTTDGVKTGTLCYLGNTEFAPGQWAGIDLDEPQGKNDGSVAGKRYFECKMKHGLFAPIHKVAKAGKGSSTARVTRRSSGPGLPLHHRSESHESINSSTSSTSSAARGGRVRIGVTSLTTSQKSSHPSTTNVTASNSTLQEALKEKEDQIEKLLQERDLERAEVARSAGQVDEAERKLATLQKEHQVYVEKTETTLIQLRELVEKVELEKKKTLSQLEDERRKVEDLQFRIEEEAINKVDLETQSEQERMKIQELERLLEEERQHSRTSDSNINQERTETEELKRYKEEMEKLKQVLSKSEEKIKLLEKIKESEANVTSELRDDIVRKDETILQLEASLESRKREVTNLKKRLEEMGEDLEHGKQRQNKQLQIIDELNVKLTRAEATCDHLGEELHTVKTHLADTERKLHASEERTLELSRQKAKLETQVSDLMQSSGDNSDHLSQMNQEIREKEKQIEELQSQLRSRTQEIEKLKDTVTSLHDQNKLEFEKITNKHKEEVQELEAKLQAQLQELQKTQEKMSSLYNTLSQQEQLVSENETKAEKFCKKLNKTESELTHTQAQLKELQLSLESLQAETSNSAKNMEGKVQQLQKELEQVTQEKEKISKQYQTAKEACIKLEKTREQLTKEKQEHQAAVSDRDVQVAQLKAEVDRLQTEFAKHREELLQKLKVTEQEYQTMQDLHNQFNLQRDALSELQNKLVHVEVERDQLYQEVIMLRGTQEERDQLENRNTSLQQQLEDLKQRESQLVNDFDSERESLKKMLESAQSQLEQQEKEVLKKDQELASLRLDDTTLQNYKVQLQNIEQEKKQLGSKIVELQVALARSQANANVEDPEYNRITEEKEALDAQIEFLNSVIVDMQRKNDELKSRIEILETGETFDSGDLNLNGIKTTIPPRLFCDICDMFDVHDTEDCPQQAPAVEKLLHIKHHGKRVQERPYCDSCGMFGHWATECDDNDTF
ncbi:CAP-Gly domain-containing linker protein 1-like isoform X2 [Limulus polyphemus]|uniref:CAP-Gly domain-containing linker protein 1-like isoform X2 n=1 Tax=Limulus polyphemus TaxID=6850 RepID=A0ABM1S6G2_LIMPO|nr:CAP-Gly domain-containing linker protein 1-like isoform X2 [Limulus polyphemus]